MSSVASALILHPRIGFILRVVLGAVFVYASLDKIAHPELFAHSIMDYKMTPAAVVIPMAVLLPWMELLAGGALVLGWMRRGSALLILTMLSVFMVAIVSALVRGIDIDCGCFSTSPEAERLAMVTLLRDVLLVLAALQVIAAPRTELELARRKRRK